jgi:hypothetical protein
VAADLCFYYLQTPADVGTADALRVRLFFCPRQPNNKYHTRGVSELDDASLETALD